MHATRGNAGGGARPEFHMPPQMIGGFVAGPALISRSDGVVLALRQVLAYPTGFEVELEAYARGSSVAETHANPLDFSRRHGQLHFRLQLADGRHVVQDDEAGLRGGQGQGSTLTVSKSERSAGGPENKEHIRLTLWAAPLPPPGPLVLTCSWPNRGLEGADLALDADAILVAAHSAQPFWPDES